MGAPASARVLRGGASGAAPRAAGQPGPCPAGPARPRGPLREGVFPGAAGKSLPSPAEDERDSCLTSQRRPRPGSAQTALRLSSPHAQGETSVRSETTAPEWNEQLSFVELFPPLTRGLRLQLRDDAPLVDAALATHVLDLTQISHSGRAGKCILPTRAAPPPWPCVPRVPPPTANSILPTQLRLESLVYAK